MILNPTKFSIHRRNTFISPHLTFLNMTARFREGWAGFKNKDWKELKANR